MLMINYSLHTWNPIFFLFKKSNAFFFDKDTFPSVSELLRLNRIFLVLSLIFTHNSCHLDTNGIFILCNSFKRSYPSALLLTTVDISEILFRYSYTFSAQHLLSMLKI